MVVAPGVSPDEASAGMAYAHQAKEKARAELSKVTFAKSGAPLVSAGSGIVRLAVDNDADYSLKAELRLSGEGLTLSRRRHDHGGTPARAD